MEIKEVTSTTNSYRQQLYSCCLIEQNRRMINKKIYVYFTIHWQRITFKKRHFIKKIIKFHWNKNTYPIVQFRSAAFSLCIKIQYLNLSLVLLAWGNTVCLKNYALKISRICRSLRPSLELNQNTFFWSRCYQLPVSFYCLGMAWELVEVLLGCCFTLFDLRQMIFIACSSQKKDWIISM